MKIEDMPLTEKAAIGILRQEGFTSIHWVSFIDWLCHFDFMAIKNGTQFYIEVKDNIYHLYDEKIMALQQSGSNILILLVNVHKRTYELFSLQELDLGNAPTFPRFLIELDKKGRVLIPKLVRQFSGIKPCTLIETEFLSENHLLLSEVK